MRRGLRGVGSTLVLGLLALGLFLHGSELARGEKPVLIHPPGLLGVAFNGGVSPKELPRDRPAPVSLSLSMELRMDDERAMPSLREVVLRLDREVAFSTEDLPVCRRSSLTGRDLRAVEATCGDAVVGSGRSRFVYTGPPIGPIPAKAKMLLVLNGGTWHGVTRLYAAYTFSPTTSAVVTRPIEVRQARGQGPRMTIEIPEPAGSRGALTDVSMSFSKEVGVFKARCQDGAHGLRVEDRFADGTVIAGGMRRKCFAELAR